MKRKDHTVGDTDPQRQRIWDHVSSFPLANLWDFQGVSPWLVARRTFNSIIEDNLVSRAAELGYYFLFALFPMLVSASAILGLTARSASAIYLRLLEYLSLVVPHEALGIVLDTFNQTTTQASTGKVTFGIAAAIWSASVGFSAIQDTLNTVYKVKETRSYLRARGSAMLVTLGLAVLVTLILACLLGGTAAAFWLRHYLRVHWLGVSAGIVVHLVSASISLYLLNVLFAGIYYFAPAVVHKSWRMLSPGAALGIAGWIVASLILRLYLHYFASSYSVTYGSLGAVIVLLTWFYITGLMLLIGAEINSEIEAAATERRLKLEGKIAPDATTDPANPVALAS